MNNPFNSKVRIGLFYFKPPWPTPNSQSTHLAIFPCSTPFFVVTWQPPNKNGNQNKMEWENRRMCANAMAGHSSNVPNAFLVFFFFWSSFAHFRCPFIPLIFGHSNSQMGARQKKGINKQISPSSSNSDESNSFLYRKFHSLFSFPFVFLLTKVSPLFNSFRLFKKQQKMHGLRDPFFPILLG
jgi:hypothetical protein